MQDFIEYVPKGKKKKLDPITGDLNPPLSGSTTPRLRDFPVVTSSYKAVWQRARNKIRAKLFFQHLGREIKLYGASTVPGSESTALENNETILRKLQAADKLTEAADKPIKQYLFVPGSALKVVWGGVYLLLMLYTAFVMPFRLAFMDSEMYTMAFWVEVVVDVLFFVDVLVRVNSAFVDNDGNLITNRKVIFFKYLKSWLLVDLAACFPFYLFHDDSSSSDTLESGNQYKSLLRMARIPRLYRLLRITRIFKFAKNFRENDCFERFQTMPCVRPSSIRLTAFALCVLLGTHLMTCLWYFLARLEGLGPETWVSLRGMADSSIPDLYVASLYWTITTLATVGYGDIIPNTSLERVIAMLWMFIGVCFFSFTIGSLATLLNTLDSKEAVLSNKLAAIDEFAEESKLDKDLRTRLKHALRYSVEQTGFSSSDKRITFNELPRQLRYEVALAMHRGAAKSIPFFSDKDQVFIASIIPFLNSTFLPASSDVYMEGDYAEEIYFIVSGRCVVMIENQHVVKRLQKGSYFGEIEVIEQVPRKFTVKTANDSDLLTMSKRIFTVIKGEFQSVYAEMVEIALIRDKLNTKAKAQFLKMLSMYQSGLIHSGEEENLQMSLQKGDTQRFSECALNDTSRSETVSRKSANESQAVPIVKDLEAHVSAVEADLATTQKTLVMISSLLAEIGIPVHLDPPPLIESPRRSLTQPESQSPSFA